MKRGLATCAVAVAMAVAGCGSDARPGAGTTDAASLAPAAALAYASFEIDPQGPEKQGFDAAFGKLLGGTPEDQLGRAFTRAAATSGKLDYVTDVKPWLGDTISGVVTKVGLRHVDGALLVAETDDAKAQAAIDKDLAGAGAQDQSYRGLSYKLLPDGTANGVVAHYLVAGAEPAFKAIVDTAKDGGSLADSEQWKASVADRASGKVGFAYVDAKAILQSVASTLPGAQRVVAPLALSLVQLHPFVGTLDAQPDALTVDVSSPGTPADKRGPGAASSTLIESLPASSWLALALPDVGRWLSKVAGALKASPLIGAEYDAIAARFRAKTGLDLEKDVLAAIGDVGLFVQGTTPRSVGGALVVESPKAGALARGARRALSRLGAHRRIQIAARGGRAVAAYGAAALRAALGPGAKLGDTVLFRRAESLLGARPTLFVDFGHALELVAQSPHHEDNPRFQEARPHLRHVELVAVGVRRDQGLDVIRAVIGLR